MSNPNYEEISRRAEADLNTYQAKTGAARPQGLDDAGVNSYAEKKFDSANVTYGDDLSTNRGYNKRIPPSEGGDLDARGRQATGKLYEGKGGPDDKFAESFRQEGGQNDADVVGARGSEFEGGLSSSDIASQGQAASRSNVGRNPPGVGGSQFKGSDYYNPESVPDSISAEGWVAPESVTQASRETEGYSER
ncbi:hypothetical protein TARUN_1187 [Trichoderma arundinaceum]|uniref:Uncharacterized protein n=1 Tax=Trichoderma arundinaceum TaxID=490622 RepID=A0A395NY44_TRIAR|nr:hypothetical protein TARUN_1187 [Trichoderma arundinaceum]